MVSPSLPSILAFLAAPEVAPCRAWTATTKGAGFVPRGPLPPSTSSPRGRGGERLLRLRAGSAPPLALEEPDNRFGRLAYWDESYRRSLDGDRADDAASAGKGDDATTFSWYCGWRDELGPFFSEVVPLASNPKILVPGIGNDACVRDMFDDGYVRLSAFDYAPEGVECARRMFGPDRSEAIDDLRVADARCLPYDDATFDAVLDKGTLDSVYLSGGKDKALARTHLDMAVSELARTVKVGGIAFSVTAACAEAVERSFDERNEGDEGSRCWKQLRDGSFWATEDGYTSNNVGATMLVWERVK
ncbi:hypothetical protein ACHAWF_002094 [Thalassiosira exigua]